MKVYAAVLFILFASASVAQDRAAEYTGNVASTEARNVSEDCCYPHALVDDRNSETDQERRQRVAQILGRDLPASETEIRRRTDDSDR